MITIPVPIPLSTCTCDLHGFVIPMPFSTLNVVGEVVVKYLLVKPIYTKGAGAGATMVVVAVVIRRGRGRATMVVVAVVIAVCKIDGGVIFGTRAHAILCAKLVMLITHERAVGFA
jgi:hypothetical protein